MQEAGMRQLIVLTCSRQPATAVAAAVTAAAAVTTAVAVAAAAAAAQAKELSLIDVAGMVQAAVVDNHWKATLSMT